MSVGANPRTGMSPVRIYAFLALAALVLILVAPDFANLTAFYLFTQDRWLLAAGLVLLMLCGLRLPGQASIPAIGWRGAAGASLAGALVAYLGHYLILAGYDLSRDEQMATFDALVFAGGNLVAPLPEGWARHADALNTMFMNPAEERTGWVSGYLPVHAGMRAGFSFLGDMALTGPAMIAIGAMALWGCIRKLWPEDGTAPFLALALYLGSGQVLVNGMTSYAMPAHLALNLVWLWLFLQRKWTADGAALVIGFLATGLHQPIMHPVFAAPILVLVVIERDWRRATLYFLGYLAIGLFWWMWPQWMIPLVEANAAVVAGDQSVYLERLMQTLGGDLVAGGVDMASNLLRFAAWQHLLLIPLSIYGLRLARRDVLAAGLAGGIALMIVLTLVILPYQGHGFGYRYLHGFIGNAILLAVFGWRQAVGDSAQWRAFLLRATAAGLLVLLPVQLWMAHAFYAPYAKVSRSIDTIKADFVVVGAIDAPFSSDLVINPPALERRPVRLLRHELDGDAIAWICRDAPRVALLGDRELEPIVRYFGQPAKETAKANRDFGDRLRQSGCRLLDVPD